MKTSIYLDAEQARRLTHIAAPARPQAEIVRDAISAYDPGGKGNRDFAIARGFGPVDDDPRPIQDPRGGPPGRLRRVTRVAGKVGRGRVAGGVIGESGWPSGASWAPHGTPGRL